MRFARFRCIAPLLASCGLLLFSACNATDVPTATTVSSTEITVSSESSATVTATATETTQTTETLIPITMIPTTIITTSQTVSVPQTTSETTPATTSESTTSATQTVPPETEPVATLDLYSITWEPPTDSNATKPLDIRTYDGYNQPCHPKVLYFPEGWNGYRYWMVYTPYPFCEDTLENPCLAVSDDGYNWSTPPGVTNPVTGLPPTYENSAHYSDPHLVMNGKTMELWFRYNPSYGDGVNADSNEGIVFRIRSLDGVHWTQPEQLYQRRTGLDPVLSPAIILEDGVYTMWYAKRDGCLYRTTTTDGHIWTPLEKTDLSVYGRSIWHQDVIKTDLGYEIVFCARSMNAASNLHGLALYYAASTDGLHWTKPVCIVSPRTGTSALDNASIYRATIVKASGGYKIYYSSMSENYIWKINLCEGPSIPELKGYGK